MAPDVLKLPPGADNVLERCRALFQEGTSLLIYGLAGVVQNGDIEGLCAEATAVYQTNDAIEEYQYHTFMTSAPKDRRCVGRNVQEVLDDHFEFLAGLTDDTGERQQSTEIFPFAFVVIEDRDWRKHGVTMVYCNDQDIYDDGKDSGWKVDECETSVLSLGGFCQDLVMEEEDWHPLTVDLGRPTTRTGCEEYLRTRSRSWSPQGISSRIARGF